MRVAIAGGGIAGMATAMALKRAGIEAEIYEAYDESAGLEAGAYLTVAVNGLDALRTIGAHEPVINAIVGAGRINGVRGRGGSCKESPRELRCRGRSRQI
jgi:2-polyprenyl-6-methoxyphenol hydroxylase-like FAD-dependent oxidoreductase